METNSVIDWHQQAQKLLSDKKYKEAARVYERAIEAEPEVRSHYWYLGMVLLLQEEEELAQAAWLVVLADASDDEAQQWLPELLLILDDEAGRQQEEENYAQAWTLRRHIREFDPENANNLLLLIKLAVKAELFIADNLSDWDVIARLSDDPLPDAHPALILDAINAVLEEHHAETLVMDFVAACIPFFQSDPIPLVNVLIGQSNQVGYAKQNKWAALRLLEIGLDLGEDHERIVDYLSYMALFYQYLCQYDKGIEVAKKACSLADSLYTQITSNQVLLRGLMLTGGHWNEAYSQLDVHLRLLQKLVDDQPQDIPNTAIRWMYNASYFVAYLRDDLIANRYIQNQVAAIAQTNSCNYHKEMVDRFQQGFLSPSRRLPITNRPLKVGYLSSCFKRHSVGWLARWIFKHHDREKVKIHSYVVNFRHHGVDPVRDWFVHYSDVLHKLDADSTNIANHIYDDDIDILIDLDSATFDTVCEVMALKPAPVQATWLGWDASGVPAIDYYFVDPYVVPDDADEHYRETLWRMPQTYIAVDGFEVGVRDLRRRDLDIPDDAVVFLSAQRGHKRYPPMVHLQMQIIRQVPNSYFLIKSLEHDASMKQFFLQVAEEEGVSGDRLRFMPDVPSEDVHRANIAIADVVLDTYPYNGATTTLETLWVGVPLVTRVGTTFSSRNSYAMMMNVGVTEGIAWNDEEYVEWGVRLGKDANLRQDISWRLWRSRQSSPLWDAKQFTRDMEHAYQQMWERHIQSF